MRHERRLAIPAYSFGNHLLMDKIRARRFGLLEYGDPRGFLVELRKLEIGIAENEMPDRVRRFRTNGLKPEREMRDAALFCLGMSERLGLQVRFAPVEEGDFDFVASWSLDDVVHYCPVQLKEVVPEDMNSNASIEVVLESLKKYSDSKDVTVAIRLNNSARFDPAALKVPTTLAIGGMWVFGSVSRDQSKWALWGDFLRPGAVPFGIGFDYPT